MASEGGLKGVYFQLEDKYYDFLDWLEEKGAPVYKLVDAIEAKNIPSFPLAIIAVLIVAFAAYSAAVAYFPANSNLAVQVFDGDNKAVSGAIVTLNFSDKSMSAATGGDGKAAFSVPLGATVTGTIKKTGFKDEQLNFVAEKTDFTKTVTMALEINVLTKTIQLMDKASGSLLKKEVSMGFSCSENAVYSKEKTTDDGMILLDDIPKDCGTLIANPTSSYSVEQGNVDLSQSAPQLRLSEIIIDRGTVKVFVKDKQGNPVAGVTIKLMRSDGVQQSSKPSSTAGSVQFDAVPVGNYYIRTYDGYNAKFADFDSSVDAAGIKQLGKDETIQFDISLTEKVVGKVKVLVKDKRSGAVIPNASVSLFRDNVSLATQSSGSDGKVEFAASESSGYSVKVDHQSYLIEFKEGISPSDSFVEILLTQADSSNILSLQASVVDQRNAPVENARLTLKKLDGTVVSDTIATGTDGNALFERIPADTYYIYAVKDGLEGVNSAPITIAERQLNSISITMSIGSGTIEVTVVDDELRPVQGATVKLVNSFDLKQMESGSTNVEGKKSFNVRADKKVFFAASVEGYADYTTIPTMPEAGNTKTVEIKLVKDVTKLQVELLGLFVDNELASDSLSAGQKYIARLQLRVPESSTFTEAGINLRVGNSSEGKTNSMESDPLYISKVNAATRAIVKSTSFTPPSGYTTDSKKLTSGNAKWANILFSKPAPGVYDIEAEIIVKENAQLGSVLEVGYRGWGKATTYLRDPQDKVLGESETAGGKQALYANAYKAVYSVGPSSLCDESFCYLFNIEDLGQELVTSVTDSYDAKMSGNYKLRFTIVSREGTEFPASGLEIGNDSAGLALGDYVITTADGKKLSGTAQGNLSVDAGDISKNSAVQGELSFKATKEGINRLNISVKSNKENVFSRGIDVKVGAANEMALDVLPKIIIPFVDNDVMLHVTDSNSKAGIAKAAVNVTLEGTTVFSGETDGSGTVHFTLQSPNGNELLRIEVSKNGYMELVKETRVTENILTITPDAIDELLTTTGVFSMERGLILRNDTTMALQIDDFQTSSDFGGLVKFSLKDNYIGTALQKDVDKNIFLKIELTDQGKRVTEVKSLEGTFSIFVSSSDIQKTWAVNVPLKIRIGFGKEVSDSTCLTIDPVEWKAYTGKNQIEQKFALKNNCKVDKTAIALRDVQIKVDYGSGTALGEFTATSTMSNSETTRLSNTFSKLAAMIGAGEEASLTVSFNPDTSIIGGEGTPKITVRAINPTANGDEELLAKVNVDLKINNLAQCIEIKNAKNLQINNCPYGTGYGNYGNYGYGGYGYLGGNTGTNGIGSYGTGAYGMQSSRFASPYQYGDTAFAGYPEQQYAQNYPYSGFSDPYYSSQYYGGQQALSSWQCGTTKFAIANNCASAVHIDLETAPELMVDSQGFDISPNEQKDVTVEASYFIGVYPIDVLAKVKDSKEKTTSLATLYTTIQMVDDPTQYNDCIKINSTKFAFNDFIQKPVTGKVFNTCYAQGVRLDYDSVKFSQSAYGETASKTEGTKTSGGTGVGLIQNVEVIDLSTKKAEGNKITQTLEFEIYKNINYRTQEGFPRTGTQFSQLGNLRVFGTAGYFRVEAPAIIIVNYSSSFGGAQSKKFQVTIEDMWNMLGTLEGMNVYGCSNIPAQSCIMDASLEFGGECLNEQFGADNVYEEPPRDIMRVGECSPEASYNTGLTSNIADIIAQYKAKGVELSYEQARSIAQSKAGTAAGMGNVCGTSDTITLDEGFGSIVQDGVVVTLEQAQSTSASVLGAGGGKRSIKVTINRSGATKLGKIDISKNLSATVYRQTPLGAQEVKIPFHVCVWSTQGGMISENAQKCAELVKTKIDPVDYSKITKEIVTTYMKLFPDCSKITEEEKADIVSYIQSQKPIEFTKCGEDGSVTGKDAYTNLGFDKLPFTWQFDEDTGIKADTCNKDGKGNYCDAVQNLIAITKKTKEITEKSDGWGDAMVKENGNNVKQILHLNDDADRYNDAKNIFRWAFKQAKINDAIKNEDRIYFLDSYGTILNAPVTANSIPQQTTKEVTEGLKNNNFDQMERMLDTISSDSKLSKEIVAEITVGNKGGITEKDKQILENTKYIDTINDGKTLVLTFEEFKDFQKNTKKACGGDWETCKKSDPEETAFYNRLLNSITFKRGIIDTDKLSIDSADASVVIKNGGLISGINRPDFDTVWKDLNSTVLLVSDGYNEKLQADFKDYYTEDKPGVGKILSLIVENVIGNKSSVVFKNGITEPGAYNMLLNYNFSLKSIDVEMKKIADPEAGIKNNWFLYHPIDGMIGSTSGRTGYGTTFPSGNDGIIIAKDGADEQTNKVTAITGTGISKFANVTVDKSFATANAGTILNTSGATFTYSPSTAFKLSLALEGVGSMSALYNIAGTIAGENTKPIFKWDNSQEKTGMKCGASDTKQYNGVETTAKSLKAPFFVPASSMYTLNLGCAKEKATLTAKEISIGQKTTKETGTISATLTTLNQNMFFPLDGRIGTDYTLKQFVDAVENGKVCIKSTQDSLLLSWNSEEIVK